MRDIVLQAVDNGKLITEFYPKSNYKIEIDWDQKLKLFEFNSRTETYTEYGDNLQMPDWEVVDGGIIRFPVGLKDRNGKWIYDGDILVFQNKNMNKSELLGYMKYDADRACWTCTKTLEDNVYGLPYNDECDNGVHDEKNVEIIGNIYQNKELIS
ncbi:YopX family protein [Paenibacillus sp. DMB20]|uniref:YopX family protein n=1 Tax=Paenibacillus sp. DMB20 TaxID=1642570 RepID=UPI0006277829|nr:YopX family protein [Paenibacillus sp. DMB20]KKO51130.1 hypothetical protein XI25_29530 [Paenibacillus sp. DMB20]